MAKITKAKRSAIMKAMPRVKTGPKAGQIKKKTSWTADEKAKVAKLCK